ncbi:tetratricopeptide (TPR) repeat protein [Catenulispora sp. EB89]|uniref:ATP-binding protein n=1 Tax=Catenulispora sp. EB89 TaxID=3156257 RepID=UPI003518D934
MSGNARDVVQARDINGGVHFHSASGVPLPTPRQLPHDVHGFVNRVTDLESLSNFLIAAQPGGPGSKVVLIAGTAGVGKSSLAVHWAHRVRNQFPDGQLHVDLHGYGPGARVEPAQALLRFLEALGVPADSIPDDLESRSVLYRSLLAERRMLVLLDNAGSAEQARPLIPAAEGCIVVVTSRSQLSGLVARDGAVRIAVHTFGDAEAVQLLRSTIDSYRGGNDNEDDVAELARLCARLPLALRIAAERAAARPMMALADLIEDLRDESSLWDALSAEDAAEADAVRTVFAWSYRALPEPAARMFRLIGLHPGADFPTGAAAALAGLPRRRAARLLDDLVGAHLIEQLASDRYRLHDLLRAYASDQVRTDESSSDRTDALARMLDWYLQSAAHVRQVAPYEQASHHARLDQPRPEVEPQRFNNYTTAIEWFRSERHNLIAVVRAAAEVGLDRPAWQIPAALSFVYAHNGYFDDWFTIGRMGLDAATREGSLDGQAALLASLGMACRQSQRLDEASEYYHAALDIHQSRADHLGEAWVLNLLGYLHLQAGRLTASTDTFQQSLNLCRRSGFDQLCGYPAEGLGRVRLAAHNAEEAVTYFREALAIHRAANEQTGQFSVLIITAEALLALRRTEEASDCISDALSVAETLENRHFESLALVVQGHVLRATGRPSDALSAYQQAGAIQRMLGDRAGELVTIGAIAVVYRDLGRTDEASDFELWATNLRRSLGIAATTTANPR